MARIGKVTSFVTRMEADGPRVCVFSHPEAGIQLPAGTLRPGEDPIDGARREVFEETGIADLTLVREIAAEPACTAGNPCPSTRWMRRSRMGSARFDHL